MDSLTHFHSRNVYFLYITVIVWKLQHSICFKKNLGSQPSLKLSHYSTFWLVADLTIGQLVQTRNKTHFMFFPWHFFLFYYPVMTETANSLLIAATFTKRPPSPACKRLQTRTIGMDPPTGDTRFLIHHYSTVDIMWLFPTQPRTSSYTPNRGHGLNSIFTSFS